LEHVREIRGGKLFSKVRAGHEIISDNLLAVSDPTGVRSLRADVALLEYEPGGSFVAGRIIFALYNDGRPGGGFAGDVFGEVLLGGSGPTPSGLFSVGRCNDPGCISFTSFLFDNVGAVSRGVPHGVGVSWDGSSVTLAFDGIRRSFDPRALAPVVGPPISGYTGLATQKFTRFDGTISGFGSGGASASFDNVRVNGSPYDDFSAAGIDRARWRTLEFVREVQADTLVMTLRDRNTLAAETSERNRLVFRDPDRIDGIQADVSLTAASGANALLMAQVVGLFFNDGRATGIPGDQTGDIAAGIMVFSDAGTVQVSYFVTQCDDFDCVNLRTLAGRVLGSVALGSRQTLFVGWDGSQFTFRWNEGPIEAVVPSVSPVKPPNVKFKGIGPEIRCFGPCDAVMSATFDDVAVLLP
jgi:hypothetical protein